MNVVNKIGKVRSAQCHKGLALFVVVTPEK